MAVRIDRETGDHHVYMEYTVVQEVDDTTTEVALRGGARARSRT